MIGVYISKNTVVGYYSIIEMGFSSFDYFQKIKMFLAIILMFLYIDIKIFE